jgi:phytoene desaturase
VGASTRPGTGVPLVTIGARLVAERIAREVGA